MEIKQLLFGGILSVIIVFVMMVGFPQVIIPVSEMGATCNGVDHFYTGNGFKLDAYTFINYANDNYNENESWYSQMMMQDPIELFENENPFNCEDISHTIECIADEYDVECNKYFSYTINEETGRMMHIGIFCMVDNKLMKLY